MQGSCSWASKFLKHWSDQESGILVEKWKIIHQVGTTVRFTLLLFVTFCYWTNNNEENELVSWNIPSCQFGFRELLCSSPERKYHCWFFGNSLFCTLSCWSAIKVLTFEFLGVPQNRILHFAKENSVTVNFVTVNMQDSRRVSILQLRHLYARMLNVHAYSLLQSCTKL